MKPDIDRIFDVYKVMNDRFKPKKVGVDFTPNSVYTMPLGDPGGWEMIWMKDIGSCSLRMGTKQAAFNTPEDVIDYMKGLI